MVDATSLLATITEHVQAQGAGEAANKAPKLATIDPLYTTGNPQVTFDGESTKSTKTYPYVRSYIPTPGDRVLLLAVGTSHLIIGAIATTSDAVPTGSVQAFAGSTAPTGWLLCNGAAVSRTTYASLYTVIGTTYGAGDGSTTFNVPNLQDRVPVGSGSTYARGATGGAATVTLTTAQIPSHSHTLASGTVSTHSGHTHTVSGTAASDGSHTHSVNNQGTRSDILAGGGTTTAATGSGNTGSGGSHTHSVSGTAASGGSHNHTLSGSTGTEGTGQAHDNLQPYLALPFIIKI